MVTKPIPSLPGYAASEDGSILNAAGEPLRQWANWNGYQRVRVAGKSRLVHRLVAEAFHGPCPSGEEVDHIDRNRANNACRNLRYLTPSANQRRAGSRPSQRKLTPEQADEIKALLAEGSPLAVLAARFGVTVGMVSHIKAGRSWSSRPTASPRPKPPRGGSRECYAAIWECLYALRVGEGFERSFTEWAAMSRTKASIESVLRRHGEQWFQITSHEMPAGAWLLRFLCIGSGTSARSSRCTATTRSGGQCRGLTEKGSVLCPAHMRAGSPPIDPARGRELRAARKAARLTLADIAGDRPSLISRLSLIETGKQRVTPAIEAVYRERMP